MEPKNKTNNTTKNDDITELVFILDRSGSMSGLEKDTIGGFNSMIGKHKAENGLVTTVIFDTEMETIHDRMNIGSVPELTDKEYFARGGTALLDAMGYTIGRITKTRNDSGISPKKTLVVITTDGYENSSKEYTYASVKQLVESKKKEGWEFIFLGANIDAIGEAAKFGIESNRAVDYHCDSSGIRKNFEAVGKIMHYCCNDASICDSWADDIKEYKRKKSRKN